MISNDDPKGMIPALLQAQNAGIKIVNIDGDLAEKSVGFTNIQSDNLLGGQLRLAWLLPDHFRGLAEEPR